MVGGKPTTISYQWCKKYKIYREVVRGQSEGMFGRWRKGSKRQEGEKDNNRTVDDAYTHGIVDTMQACLHLLNRLQTHPI